MAKMGCRPNQRLAQGTGQPDDTEEVVVQDSDQSDHSVQVSDSEEFVYSGKHLCSCKSHHPISETMALNSNK